MLPDDDPGWPWKRLLVVAVPFVGPRLSRRETSEGRSDGLVLTRQLFFAFSSAIVLFGVVVLFNVAGAHASVHPPTGLVVGLLALGALVAVAGGRFERPLDGTTDATLIVSYRKRFFVRIGSGEAAALLGFVGSFIVSAFWPYAVGAFVTAIAFRRAAPTRRNLRRDQESLSKQACYRSLVRALRFMGPPS